MTTFISIISSILSVLKHLCSGAFIMRFASFLTVFIVSSVLISCKEDNPINEPPPNPDVFENIVLVYASASNDLYPNLVSDRSEMLKGLEGTDPLKSRLFLYESSPVNSASGRTTTLYEAIKNYSTGTYEFKLVKNYPTDVFTTDPSRLSEVIYDVKKTRNAKRYGLVLWSHGGGWDPAFSDHQTKMSVVKTPPPTVAPDPGLSGWWGVDNNDGKSDKMDIDELADAIPDDSFEFIWFDCCYMGSIEVAYQLRRKARYFVGYPTEVYSPGLDYTSAIPFLLSPEPDLAGAARSLYNYYTFEWSQGAAVTVGVFDLTKIDKVVDVVRQGYAAYEIPSVQGLVMYSRGGVSRLYDFRQTLSRIAEETGVSLSPSEINSAFDAFTVCKYASERNFSGHIIPPGDYSGLSTHIYSPEEETPSENFYRRLDWFDAVFPKK